nr:LysR substrate-binding domain-containing protein [Burkholderia sp. Tr-20355]
MRTRPPFRRTSRLRVVPLTDDSFDVCIRFGEPPDTRVVARRLASNRRLLCASRAARPHAAHLHRHPARRRRVRRLTNGHGSTRHTEAVRINGNRTTNDGKIAVKWALDGHGILMHAERDLRDYLADGRLAVVLPDHEMPSADVYAVYAQRHQTSARIRAFVDFLAEALGRSRGG